MRVVLIGAGRLATNLGYALHEAGHNVLSVYSRMLANAETLTRVVGGFATNTIESLPTDADVYIFSVKDDVLPDLITQATQHILNLKSQTSNLKPQSSNLTSQFSHLNPQIFLHTAGSLPLSLFAGKCCRYGVFYPMQTFSKERQVDFSEIPVFIEASDDNTLAVTELLAQSVTHKVYHLSTEDRKYLHLAAVLACNFSNHCYALAAEVLESHGLPFDVMLPLIDETARKVHDLHPRDAQTGPAVRYDENVISMQRQLLASRPDIQRLYDLMSKSIHHVSVKS